MVEKHKYHTKLSFGDYPAKIPVHLLNSLYRICFCIYMSYNNIVCVGDENLINTKEYKELTEIFYETIETTLNI